MKTELAASSEPQPEKPRWFGNLMYGCGSRAWDHGPRAVIAAHSVTTYPSWYPSFSPRSSQSLMEPFGTCTFYVLQHWHFLRRCSTPRWTFKLQAAYLVNYNPLRTSLLPQFRHYAAHASIPYRTIIFLTLLWLYKPHEDYNLRTWGLFDTMPWPLQSLGLLFWIELETLPWDMLPLNGQEQRFTERL